MRMLLEGLEGRALLSASPSISFDNPAPAQEMAGAVINLDVPVRITNVGDAAAVGSFKLKLVASTDGTVSKQDLPLAAATKKLTILPGESAVVDMVVKSFPGKSPGNYLLLAELDHSQPQVKVKTFAQSSSPVEVIPPAVDLVGTAITLPATGHPSQSFNFSIQVQNNGGKVAKGSMQIATGMATDLQGTDFVQLTTFVSKVNIKPGKVATVKLKMNLGGGAPLGAQFLFVTVDSNNAFAESTVADKNVVSAGTILIS
jgi:hypothetical protein